MFKDNRDKFDSNTDFYEDNFYKIKKEQGRWRWLEKWRWRIKMATIIKYL